MKADKSVQVSVTEKTNQSQGKGADAATKKIMGPAVPGGPGNPTSGGGINRPTKGRA